MTYSDAQLGQGCERWVKLGGISLLIIDVVYQDDIYLGDAAPEDIYSAESEIGSHLRGDCCGLEAGKNFRNCSTPLTDGEI
ncbi:hypothetical protein ACKFKF_21640 [Phormidesmis sp. 146-12]